jgi:hypothetical protein
MMKEKDAVLLFHLPFELKANLEAEAKQRKLSMTKLVNALIADCLKKKTGRGNRANDHELVMDYLRKIHPETASGIMIARETGIDRGRVMIILNNLSGLKDNYAAGDTDGEFPFLVYEQGEDRHTEYGISKDVENGIYAYQEA